MKKGDLIIAVTMVILVAASFLGKEIYQSSLNDTKKVAIIKQDGKEIKRIDLSTIKAEDITSIERQYKVLIHAVNGKIRFEEANCPDQVCVKTGWITDAGDSAVCLPNKTSVTIEGSRNDVDDVTF